MTIAINAEPVLLRRRRWSEAWTLGILDTELSALKSELCLGEAGGDG